MRRPEWIGEFGVRADHRIREQLVQLRMGVARDQSSDDCVQIRARVDPVSQCGLHQTEGRCPLHSVALIAYEKPHVLTHDQRTQTFKRIHWRCRYVSPSPNVDFGSTVGAILSTHSRIASRIGTLRS